MKNKTLKLFEQSLKKLKLKDYSRVDIFFIIHSGQMSLHPAKCQVSFAIQMSPNVYS